MDLTLFDYAVPDELIAHEPASERSASRLMVLDPQRHSVQHKQFTDITQFFGPEDLIIFNDVKVFPSRLYGRNNVGRKIEVLLLDQKTEDTWHCLVRPANKIKDGTELIFSEALRGVLTGEKEQWLIIFRSVGARCNVPRHNLICEIGLPPLPPYIKRDDPFSVKEQDQNRYQTVYAKNPGAAAAPTAGFHFTEAIKQQLRNQGAELAYLTLHVGRDTFQPVRTNDITQHKMHGESYEIPESTAQKIIAAKKAGRRVTAIGTTTLRALESVGARCNVPLQAGPGYTEMFIYPGYAFNIVDRLLTNFHQPKSTLLILVSAFAGREFILDAYQTAIREQYRLFSFGDAMLILNTGL